MAALTGITGEASLAGWFQGNAATLGTTTLPGSDNTATSFVTLVPTLATIATVAPASAAPGQTVTLRGTGFAGVKEVVFNGTPAASFAVHSPSQLTAVVPTGATTSPVSVRSAAGTGVSVAIFSPTTVTAVAAADAPGVRVWPNPSSANYLVRVQLPAGAEVAELELRNGLGQVVGRSQCRGHSGTGCGQR